MFNVFDYKWKMHILDAMTGNYRIVMLPTIDVIAHDTYEYRRQTHKHKYASRGAFSWYFKYKLIPLQPSDILHITKPFESPVMAGGLFVITATFFWEIGGYDLGLNTYGLFCNFVVFCKTLRILCMSTFLFYL